MTQAVIEFEKGKIEKMVDEEKGKESNIDNLKPKKKRTKDFRRSKKLGRCQYFDTACSFCSD